MISKMMFCPVGNHAELGELVKGRVCSFVCKECMFVFTWDAKGKLCPPMKVDTKKKKDICDCGGCQARDEKKYYQRPGA